MKLKDGASLVGVQWQTFDAAIKVEACYALCGVETVITSGTDDAAGRLPNSLHPKGLALDFRSYTVPAALRMKLVKNIKAALSADYDVVDESDHIHVEYDPK